MTSTTWTQTAGMDSGTDSDTVLSYAEAAAASATASASSATAAANSATTSADSATAAGASATAAASSASSAAASASAAESYATSSNISTVAGSISNVNAVGGNITSVTGVYGALTDISGVYADLADISTVAGISADVTTVAGIASNVSTVAGITADISSVVADATDIGTVASISGNINTVADISGDVTTVAGMNSDISAVIADAVDIGAVASNVSNISSVAALEDEISTLTAAGVLTDVATVAGITANIATVASDSVEINILAPISGQIGTVSSISPDVTTVAGVSGDITTVVGSLSTIVAVNGGLSDINTVASNLTPITTVSTNIADVTTVAAVSSDVSTVAAEIDALIDIQGSVDAAAASAAAASVDADDAQSALTQTQSARDTANLHKIAAEAAATSATNTAAALTGFDLEAIAASKAVTAVDVFVYDTSKDSDGGAWRKRTQHTSWYNETLNTATRGSRREFPAVAVIVAEAAKVTIYDGDDPTLPMWMVFNAANTNHLLRNAGIVSVEMINCKLVVATVFAYSAVVLFEVSFASDAATGRNTAGLYEYIGNIATRNSGVNGYTLLSGSGSQSIVNNTILDVAMTVLPDAPIDPATGIQVPTIAVATDGGVSVIKDDGTVVDITGQTQEILHVSFNSDEELITTGNYQDQYFVYSLPTSDIAYNNGTYRKRFYTFVSTPALMGGVANDLIDAHIASNEGLTILAEDKATPANSMVAYTTSTYNTGWMNGDIKGAFLSDTDDTDLVGSGELVTNGTFDTDLTGWTQTGNDASNYWEWASNAARCVSAGSFVPLSQACLTTGERYVLTLDVTVVSGGLKIGSTATAVYNDVAANISASGTYTYTFTAFSDTLYFARYSGVTDVTIDNISVKLADADRSVNNKGLIVNGTVTRTAVATGADLVAYSGFSASNYLEQPYNSDLDFGTGDFCVMGWVKPVSANADYIFDCRQETASPTGFFIYINGSGQPTFYTQQAGTTTFATSPTALSLGVWQQVVGLRKSGVNYLYLNGVLVGYTAGATQNVNDTGRKLIVGNSVGLFSYHALQGSIALLRISATAPTAEQIKKIYEDEKVLFQENAACTLYGSSDAVTALAHDSDTGLLHVGTSAGRSVFQGLRRVSNTTTAVGTAISASNNLIVEE
jgi:hypothetical protein